MNETPINFSEKQRWFIKKPFTHCLDVAEGSPRSGKTFAATARYAVNLIRSRDLTHLIVAYSQEQAYRLIIEGDGFGLLHIFDGYAEMKHDDNGDHLLLHLPNGDKKVYYKGGGKVDSRKSITGLSLGSVYFCEIDLLNQEMIQECFRRTFAAKDRFHIADLNPPSPMHPVITEVFDVQDTDWSHWTLDDNPIITEERKEEIRRTCEKNKFLYKRDWLGERTIPQGVIYSMFEPNKHILQMFPKSRKIEMYFAGDGGLTDATSISCNIIAEYNGKKCLFRVANWYYDGGEKAMSEQAREIMQTYVPYCRGKFGMMESCWKIDPACKALRKELELYNIVTDGADNNAHDIKGSRKGIGVGIEYLQSAIADGLFYVVEDEIYSSYNFLREIGLYCVDSNGNPVDKYNHAMDEARYANNYFYKNYVIA
nr:MAG TPA: large terminase [Caudoviricetes sp.]